MMKKERTKKIVSPTDCSANHNPVKNNIRYRYNAVPKHHSGTRESGTEGEKFVSWIEGEKFVPAKFDSNILYKMRYVYM
jgi:hypothetical protein